MSTTYTEWERDRTCTSKRRFHCQLDANEALLRAFQRGEYMRSYECEHCGHIHLTTREEG